MKRFLAAGAALVALLGLVGQAAAADLGRRGQQMPVKAPYMAPVYNWTGLYLGINGGGGWGRSAWTSPGLTTGDFNLSGGMIGGTAGYNWQAGQAVFGLEGDIDWANIKGSTTTA